ncbi:hypothetical protein FDK21_13350 [Cohaesibacter sp. CAU 1516]|uniref:hypothetical protein n=1 Tax=Cohaesibacter sp. CAU 1516 TaxID=2576038 RepID=UPI0010FF01C5|nr:hypothetical protein [Cohaesibacter sp. CAU 1516]TLP45709.1 hypothetical protein FDK21_13350 [Cohaesibacter sp. CAU 1516]
MNTKILASLSFNRQKSQQYLCINILSYMRDHRMMDFGKIQLNQERISEFALAIMDLYQKRYEQEIQLVPEEYQRKVDANQLLDKEWRRARELLEGAEADQEYSALLGRKCILLMDIVHRAAHIMKLYDLRDLNALYLPRNTIYRIGCEMIDLFEMKLQALLQNNTNSSRSDKITATQPATNSERQLYSRNGQR